MVLQNIPDSNSQPWWHGDRIIEWEYKDKWLGSKEPCKMKGILKKYELGKDTVWPDCVFRGAGTSNGESVTCEISVSRYLCQIRKLNLFPRFRRASVCVYFVLVCNGLPLTSFVSSSITGTSRVHANFGFSLLTDIAKGSHFFLVGTGPEISPTINYVS